MVVVSQKGKELAKTVGVKINPILVEMGLTVTLRILIEEFAIVINVIGYFS